jgi:hypothetical protein
MLKGFAAGNERVSEHEAMRAFLGTVCKSGVAHVQGEIIWPRKHSFESPINSWPRREESGLMKAEREQ